MQKIYSKFFLVFFLLSLGALKNIYAQSGTEFWFAPPDITDLHNPPGGEPIYLLLSSTGTSATVTVSQPANGAFVPIVVTIAANKSARINLTAFKASLETRPTNTIANTGLRIQSTSSITAYYDIANTNNSEIFALKGPTGLGTEFYVPLPKHAPFFNHTFAAPHTANATFDIVATQNSTTVTIYSPVAVDGHPALTQFSIILNQGQTYSCGWTGASYEQPSTHPSGAVVLADKPIAVSVKDDSDHNPSGGCYDVTGDQIVPVSVLGNDYVAVKGGLNNTGDESLFITATENNTQVYIDGSGTAAVTLFAGETYRIDMDYLAAAANNSVYAQTSKPSYAVHVTGFGCEMGSAILPPLNCAGSSSINFVRSTAESFFVTLLARATTINNFTITGPGTATINPASFVTVPGTGGVWMAAKIQYNTTEIPVDSTFRVSNSADVFALGLINGGAGTGCKYGYFSEFVAPIVASAGPDQSVCANDTAQLSGTITGGASAGIWTRSGTGTFLPNSTTLNAKYVPSLADIASQSVTITLTSTGSCSPQTDQMILTLTPAPVVNAGADQSICVNNPNVTLTGTVTIASGGVWSGGAGTYNPSNSSLNTIYTPTAGEISSGTLLLTLTSTGNGTCNPVTDNIIITFTPAPLANAGADQSICGNNPAVTLAGSVTGATGGVWSGGSGSYNPSNTALNAVYTPTGAEISAGNLTLTVTTTGMGNCSSVSDQMNITFTLPPTTNAGINQTLCGNNATITLAGGVTVASGGQWTGGLGNFTPNNTSLNATYAPTLPEIASGTVTLTLTTTGNGNCASVADNMTATFTTPPTVDAGTNQTVCADNPAVTLNGSFSIATGILWSGGTGAYNPNNTTFNAIYTPSAAEITAGTATLTATTTGNGSCLPVTDNISITISPAPIVNAGTDITVCKNNPAATLGGSVTFAGGGIWSGGAGSYNPNNTALNAIYTPTAGEILSGVSLTLTSTGNGLCNPVSDVVNIIFSNSPVSNAGSNQTVCANNAAITLAGSVSIATGGQWTGGLGIFSPNNTTLNATYTPTLPEIASGSVTLILTTTGNGNCNAVSSNMTTTFSAPPTVDAGGNQTSCANNSAITLNGSYTISSGAIWSGGSGTYNPNNTTMNAIYTPSAAEITAGAATLTLTSTGNGNCNAVTDDMSITIIQKPTVNAGTDQTTCISTLTVQLSGSITGVTNTGIWSSTGTGSFSNNNILNPTYTCSSLDSINQIVKLILSSTNNGICIAVVDTMILYILPAGGANAGNNATVCANNASVSLAGQVTGSATGGTWTTSGTGIFSPNATTLNAIYIPSSNDAALGNITLTLTANSCNSASDQLVVTITPAPVVNAGSDQTICSSVTSVSLAGNVSGGTITGIWTSTGNGSFSPNNTTLNATYTPSASDISTQIIYLVLTSSNNGSCVATRDTMRLSIYPSATTLAGPDQTVCSNNANVLLNGLLTGGATAGIWSTSGTGVFNPNATTLNATYTPSSADITSGSINIILTATNSCNIATDFLTVIISAAPTVNAGNDQSICGSNPNIQLSGAIVNAAGGIWSGGSGTFNPSSTSLNPIYTPTTAEVNSGNLTLTLTSTGNGICNAVTDQMSIVFTASILANAGVDQSVCKTSGNAQMQGIVSNGSTTGAWTTLGSGTFIPNDSALNALYQYSTADTSAGSVTLILTSTNNGQCAAAKDTVIVTFGPSAFAYAGVDQTICKTNPVANLNGLASGGSSTGLWATLGTGTFNPDNITLNASYTLGATDLANGMVKLILNTTNNGSCAAGKDTMTIFATDAPNVLAGNDQSICANTTLVLLNGTISGGTTTGIWSSGSGTFNPDNTTLNSTYTPSASDIISGTAQLILTSTNNGVCAAAKDTMTIFIKAESIANAGVNQTICSSTSSVSLGGTVSGGTTTGQWLTLGSGSFTPSNTDMNANYLPSAADISNGSVQLILTSTNNSPCAAKQDTVLITIIPAPQVFAGNNVSICASASTWGLNGTVNGGGGTGIWTTTGFGTFSPNNTTLNPNYVLGAGDATAGSIFVILTSTNNGACAASTDSMRITITTPSIASAGVDQTSCSTSPAINLNGNVSGGSTTTGQWSTLGSGSFSPGNTSLTGTYTAGSSDISTGTVTLILTTTNNAGCTEDIDSMTIIFVAEPQVFAGNDVVVCSGTSTIQLNASINGGTTTGSWISTGSGSFSPNNTTLNATYVLSSADVTSGSIQLILTSTNNGNCTADKDTLTVSIGTKPVAAFTSTASGLTGTFTDQSSQASTWLWDFGNGGGSSTQQNPIYTYNNSGTYTVTLLIQNTAGCSDTTSATVTIVDDAVVVSPVAVPSGFTPNTDGNNDGVPILGGPFESVELTIYNEWGNMIFQTTDESIAWDGTYKGVAQPAGVYVYTAKGKTIDGKEFSFSGDVTLIK